MTALHDIGVKVESLPAGMTGNIDPLLHEVKHALLHLRDTGQSTTIDLSTLPFGPGEKERLIEFLGHGEVDARVSALNTTQIRESAFPGVWIVEYQAPDGGPLATHIEVTRIPTLLQTPEPDLADSLAGLAQKLNTVEAVTEQTQ